MRLLFQRVVYHISTLAAALAALILVGMVILILVEITLRAFFASSTFVLEEFVGYGVAAVTFLSLGYTLENGSLIRVNILLAKASESLKKLMEVTSAMIALALVSLFGWFIFHRALRHWYHGVVSSSIAETPIWIPQALILIGLLVFWLQLLACSLRKIFGASKREATNTSTMSTKT